MGSVNIDSEDSISVKEFEDGKSIQVRVIVSKKEKPDYDKGKSVKVIHQDGEMTGRIVSEPILIDRKREDGKVTLSLIVEKAP
jgi:predicted ribosome-associated RNA-binding protein Tma20